MEGALPGSDNPSVTLSGDSSPYTGEPLLPQLPGGGSRVEAGAVQVCNRTPVQDSTVAGMASERAWTIAWFAPTLALLVGAPNPGGVQGSQPLALFSRRYHDFFS